MVRISITKNNYVLSNVTSSFLVIKSIRIICSYLSSLQDSTLSGILYHDFYKTTLFWPSFCLWGCFSFTLAKILSSANLWNIGVHQSPNYSLLILSNVSRQSHLCSWFQPTTHLLTSTSVFPDYTLVLSSTVICLIIGRRISQNGLIIFPH